MFFRVKRTSLKLLFGREATMRDHALLASAAWNGDFPALVCWATAVRMSKAPRLDLTAPPWAGRVEQRTRSAENKRAQAMLRPCCTEFPTADCNTLISKGLDGTALQHQKSATDQAGRS